MKQYKDLTLKDLKVKSIGAVLYLNTKKQNEEMIEKNGVSSGRYKNRLTKCTNNI